MHKLYVLGLVMCSAIVSLGIIQTSHATGSDVVISQIKVGNSSSSRLIEVYNNSNSSVDITNWCLLYSSPSNVVPYTNLGCFSDPNPTVHVFLDAHTFALFASVQTGLSADMVLTAGLGSGTSGHVYLFDSSGSEVDRVGWGTAINAESRPVVLDSTKVIERRRDAALNKFIDTDNNENDFIVSNMRIEYQYGAIYEVVDLCGNITGIQEIVPIGYTLDTNNNCNPPPIDVCKNLDGLQTVVPDQYWLDENGDCKKDTCLNISGVQQKLPNGMKYSGDGLCILDLLSLQITELLPNPIGSDEGNEFIEIYNSNPVQVNLSNYRLIVGVTKYEFPAGSTINSNQYLSFTNDNIKFTLINTTSNVKLVSSDDQQIDESVFYVNPNDGYSWALIDGLWQYTNQPTQGLANLSSLILPNDKTITSDSLAPCGANQYRSPETNRCRLFASSVSTLAACKVGQYRSEETNRCRSIVLDVSQPMPCTEGQERNPNTNRCRSTAAVLGANNLTPCKAGQERNPETNRCRNVVGTIPTAGYAPEQANESSNNSILMWSLISVGAIAICYGIWEWRQEIIGLVKKIKFGFNNK